MEVLLLLMLTIYLTPSHESLEEYLSNDKSFPFTSQLIASSHVSLENFLETRKEGTKVQKLSREEGKVKGKPRYMRDLRLESVVLWADKRLW
jgi:hypothetical protein